MTKQEKIKEAYGDYYGECNPFIDADGWFDKNAFYNNSLSIRYSNMNELFVHKGDFMRPKSLQGIEDNNGWIKIESEEDLPKKNGHYWVKRGNEICSNYIIYPESYSPTFIKNLTHYQPIETPEPPIY